MSRPTPEANFWLFVASATMMVGVFAWIFTR